MVLLSSLIAEAGALEGREVGKVLINGLDGNLEQVQRGFAWLTKPTNATISQ